MDNYTIEINEKGNKLIRTNHKASGMNYGDYVGVPDGASMEYAEQVYRNVWKTAKAFCEKAGAGLHRIQMIVKLFRVECEIHQAEGIAIGALEGKKPVMTIGWTLYLTDEENARLSKEDIASIAGGIFAEEE